MFYIVESGAPHRVFPECKHGKNRSIDERIAEDEDLFSQFVDRVLNSGVLEEGVDEPRKILR